MITTPLTECLCIYKNEQYFCFCTKRYIISNLAATKMTAQRHLIHHIIIESLRYIKKHCPIGFKTPYNLVTRHPAVVALLGARGLDPTPDSVAIMRQPLMAKCWQVGISLHNNAAACCHTQPMTSDHINCTYVCNTFLSDKMVTSPTKVEGYGTNKHNTHI